MVSDAHITWRDKICNLSDYCRDKPAVSIFEITEKMGVSSHYFLIFFLAIPFLQPLSIPFFSSLIGSFIMYCSTRIVANKPLYIPKKMGLHTIASKKVQKVCAAMLRFSKKMARWVRPRGKIMTYYTFLRRVDGSIMFVMALLLAMPLPIPLSNTLPAITLAMLSLGALEEDGTLTIIGWVFSVVTLAYFAMIAFIPISLLIIKK